MEPSLWLKQERIDPLRLTRSSSWFDVMNSAVGGDSDRLRTRLDTWWKPIPEPFRTDLAGKIRSGSDAAAHGAVAVLFLNQELLRIGYLVEPGQVDNQTPDLVCRTSSGDEIVVEVTSLNPSDNEVGAQKRINALLDSIDDPGIDRRHFLAVMPQVVVWVTEPDFIPVRDLL